MLQEQRSPNKCGLTHILTLSCALLNWITHFYICSIVGSYYHVISLAIILFIYWCHSGLRILILLTNYIMNVHIFCHYYDALNTSSVLLIFMSSIMLIMIAFIKLYTARKVFMETCFTTTIIFYIILNFYIFVYYMITYYSVDTYYSLDKLCLSLCLWMICCWNVKVNELHQSHGNHNNRLTITAIVGIISQAIFLLRFIPFIIEYNEHDIPLIILIILCIHIGSILIIFLSIDLSNELQLKMTTNTISFGFSLILSIWVEYLLVVFYFVIYFVMHYSSLSATGTAATSFSFGDYNFILLSIPGSIPWCMIMFANYRRGTIYHHMCFTEIFDNYNNKMPVHSIQKISAVLVRYGIGTSLIPIPVLINQGIIIDSVFALLCLFGYDCDDMDANDNASIQHTKQDLDAKSLRMLNKQYHYLRIEARENKVQFIKDLMKQYIESNAIKISAMYNLIFYHENVALFLSICFVISRFVSCIVLPIVWYVVLRRVDNEHILSLNIVQNWIVYVILVLYLISFLPFIYNIYCVLHCGYYFLLISPIKISDRSVHRIAHACSSSNGTWSVHHNILPQFVENTKRNKVIWSCIKDKNIASIIILYLPNDPITN
eukprot:110034_1